MQLMPSTAKALGVEDSFDPKQNINAGVRYFKQLINKLNGDAELALAAYNAGPGAVIAHRGIPPYPETQSYVPLILGMVEQYGTITGGSPAGMGDLNGTGGWPVNAPVTSPFGYRFNPIGGYSELHDVIDFGSPCGTPGIAPLPAGGFGNRVVLQHNAVTGSSYSHMTSFPVSVGQTVTAGQIVGYVGTTGWSTGCHLHFSVTQNGAPIDPATVIS